ncbi:uncharacterized protein [Physcomitrium patens]|uniref:Uncharacterized protein n=1 Tax=Physcomitrium patens TaxID=3218 RepID=A0A7I4ELG1_PHYPA|nr:uncharacterized protein LOC112286430 isoform X2 [Physcomitrium patens]|eukprot:XP_024384073.1 uncharacterized protein LOC112286430 isoform X2 [Physcomitrella patens]
MSAYYQLIRSVVHGLCLEAVGYSRTFDSGRVEKVGNDYMAKAAQVLPMDLDQDARSLLQQQQEGHNKELDRKDSVRARLLAISRVEPVVSGSPLCSMMPLSPVKVKRSPESTHQGGSEDEFRRKLISISYADVILPDQ